MIHAEVSTQIYLMKYIVEFLMFADAAICSKSSYLSYVFLQVGRKKNAAKQGLKILWIHCQNSALIMTNGIRKVRLGVDIIDKRILDSCKFISDSASEYGLVYGKFFSQLAEHKLVS